MTATSKVDALRRQLMLASLGAVGARGALAQDRAARNLQIYLYKGADRDARLLEGARKEGQLSLYTSFNTKDSAPITEAFERLTGVKVLLWRSSSEKVLQRVVTEARAGRHACDVLEAELVASGEVPIAATIYNHNIERLIGKGAPVKWKALNPTFGRTQRHWRGAAFCAPARRAAVHRLHALAARPAAHQEPQPGARQHGGGQPPEQVPLRDDRPRHHARRSREVGQTVVRSFPQGPKGPARHRLGNPDDQQTPFHTTD